MSYIEKKQKKVIIYKIYAFDGDDYNQVNLEIESDSEEKAIEKAKKLVKRNIYSVYDVKEE